MYKTTIPMYKLYDFSEILWLVVFASTCSVVLKSCECIPAVLK